MLAEVIVGIIFVCFYLLVIAYICMHVCFELVKKLLLIDCG